MNFGYSFITVQDVPDEIALAISLSGCPLKCKGCHSVETWDPEFGNLIDEEILNRLIEKNRGISCVLFYGGEWNMDVLNRLFLAVKSKNLKVALYTGLEKSELTTDLLHNLDFLKFGRWKKDLGGLTSQTTNQEFWTIKEGEFHTQKHFRKKS
jgi:anaerobic ribonucleoside-triphosphate reductase activating protein